MMLLKRRAGSNYVSPVRKLLSGFSPIWCCSEKSSGLNRINHPDWVIIYVDSNGQINKRAIQKYEVLSATRRMEFGFICYIIVEGFFLYYNFSFCISYLSV